jgi:hypothetical protein
MNINPTTQCTCEVTQRHLRLTIVALEKSGSVTYSECVSVALCIQHVNAHAPYYIVICGLSGSTVFLHIIT